MSRFSQANPFSRRDSHTREALITYKVVSVVSWLVVVIASLYYTFNAPHDDVKSWRHSIWKQNSLHPSPFSLNAIITSLYWLALYIGQAGYIWSLFSDNIDYVNAAAGVGSHFIVHNLLHFAFVMLFVRSHFVWAEVILIINFFNLSSLYFRHNQSPRFIHIPVVSGPLAWSFVALYWNGAIAVNAQDLAARILANIAIWGILVYGLFFLVIYKDYTIGFALSILTAALGTHQFLIKFVALQWIFAFTIMGVLFLSTLAIGVPGILGKEFTFRRNTSVVSQDQERAPLLDDN